MKRALGAIVAAVLCVGILVGHDTWLVPASFTVTAGEKVAVAFNTSMEFPTSDGLLAEERIARYEVWTEEAGATKVTEFRAEGMSLIADITAGSGMTAVGAATWHNIIELEGEVFTEYITEEGLEHVVKARADRGESDAMGRERYSKVVKTYLCEKGVGGKAKPAPAFGLDVEIMSISHPCAAMAGEEFSVQVLFEGKPLADVVVATGTEGTEGHHYTSQTRTDKDGRATVTFPKAGNWFVRTLHMIPNRDFDDADWQSWFSTITVQVR